MSQKETTSFPVSKVTEEYSFIAFIGRGGFATVYLGQNKKNKEHVAIKMIEKRGLTDKEVGQVKTEISVLHMLNHPNLLKIISSGDDLNYFFIVTELCNGGELFEEIQKREFYTEKDAQKVLRSLASALAYCHERGIAHRDLKPENILIAYEGEEAVIKLADFGFAKQIEVDEELNTSVGTAYYAAPEIIRRLPYSLEVDMWSFGVIMYVLLCGYQPFYDEQPQKSLMKTCNGTYEFASPYWDNVSESAKDLIRQLLVVDPQKRLTISGVLKHKWIHEELPESRDITPMIDQLRQLLLRRTLKRGVLTIMTAVKMKSFTDKLLFEKN